jgi:hypothetical protein
LMIAAATDGFSAADAAAARLGAHKRSADRADAIRNEGLIMRMRIRRAARARQRGNTA